MVFDPRFGRWYPEGDRFGTIYRSDDYQVPTRKGRLYFTVGTARSGKSTYCTRWAHFLEDRIMNLSEFYPRVIVCGDDFRLAITGQRFNKHAEPTVWEKHTYAAKALLTRGHDVIIDGTNTTEDSFWRIFNIDHNAQYRLFDTDPEVCKQRALDSGHTDLVTHGVIDRHARQIRELKEQEGGIPAVVEKVRHRVITRWRLDAAN